MGASLAATNRLGKRAPPSNLLGPPCTAAQSSAPSTEGMCPAILHWSTQWSRPGVGNVARMQSRCGALTEKGTRCRRLTMIGASRCNLHRGEWSSYTIEKRKEAERQAKTRKRPK